jgi:hypothetical protein
VKRRVQYVTREDSEGVKRKQRGAGLSWLYWRRPRIIGTGRSRAERVDEDVVGIDGPRFGMKPGEKKAKKDAGLVAENAVQEGAVDVAGAADVQVSAAAGDVVAAANIVLPGWASKSETLCYYVARWESAWFHWECLELAIVNSVFWAGILVACSGSAAGLALGS